MLKQHTLVTLSKLINKISPNIKTISIDNYDDLLENKIKISN